LSMTSPLFQLFPLLPRLYTVSQALNSFNTSITSSLPVCERTRLLWELGRASGPRLTPHNPLAADLHDLLRFCLPEITTLYNDYLLRKQSNNQPEDSLPHHSDYDYGYNYNDIGYDKGAGGSGISIPSSRGPENSSEGRENSNLHYLFAQHFLESFSPWFESGELSIAIVFNCLLWFESVLLTTPQRVMSHNHYFSREIKRKMFTRGQMSQDAGNLALVGGVACATPVYENRRSLIRSTPLRCTLRNPIYAGADLLQCLIITALLDSSTVASVSSSFHYAIHIYNGLKQCGFISSPIPILEHLTTALGPQVFGGTGDLPTPGNLYTRCLLVSHRGRSGRRERDRCAGVAETETRRKGHEEPLHAAVSVVSKSHSDELDLTPLSCVSRLLSRNTLPPDVTIGTNDCVDVLRNVERVVTRDLFDSRVLGLDYPLLHDLFQHLFVSLRDRIPMGKEAFDAVYAEMNEELDENRRINKALQIWVYSSVLPFLDTWPTSTESASNRAMVRVCECAAATLCTLLGEYDVDHVCFLPPLDATRESHLTTFGSTNVDSTLDLPTTEKDTVMFGSIMERLSKAKASLTPQEMFTLKKQIRAHPKLAQLVYPGLIPTILDYFIHGGWTHALSYDII
jgi:hypothetical protein